MNDLFREHAPISVEAWREIDAEATRTLKTLLAARRLVDFNTFAFPGLLGGTSLSVAADENQPPQDFEKFQAFLAAKQKGATTPEALQSIGEEPFATTTSPFPTKRTATG